MACGLEEVVSRRVDMTTNVFVVEVVRRTLDDVRMLHFWPYHHWIGVNSGNIEVSWWPRNLVKQLSALGVYSIQRVSGNTKGAIKVGIKWDADEAFHPAAWIDGERPVCQQLLDHLGVKTPEGWKERHFHLKVTKI